MENYIVENCLPETDKSNNKNNGSLHKQRHHRTTTTIGCLCSPLTTNRVKITRTFPYPVHFNTHTHTAAILVFVLRCSCNFVIVCVFFAYIYWIVWDVFYFNRHINPSFALNEADIISGRHIQARIKYHIYQNPTFRLYLWYTDDCKCEYVCRWFC